MKRTLVQLGMATCVAVALVGCGGGGGGGGGISSVGSTGSGSGSGSSTSTAITTSGATSIATLTTTDWGNLEVGGSVQSVTINSAPEVTFQLLDAGNGNKALEGIEQNTTLSTANATYNTANPTAPQIPAGYSNIAFSIAKLVPGTNGSPNRWVSYIVTTVPSSTATTSVPTRPTTDNNGTLTYLGNGQYKYTFYRDIKQIAAQVAAAAETATNKNADLDDLSYDPSLVHRVVIQISGVARGSYTSATTTTSCNTPNGTCVAGGTNGSVAILGAYVPIRTPADIVFDWIPATGRVVNVSDTDVAQREIVNVNACASCHNKFTFHGGNALTGVGGARQETRMCIVCHTDQRKYGRPEPTTTATGYSGTVYRISGLDQAADGTPKSRSIGEFPIFIHKIHMGEELTKTGTLYAGVDFNEIKYPQLITNCAKCHSGATTKPDGTPNTITKQDGSVVQMATVQGDNWKNKPSRRACGACHDGIDFNTGTGTTLAGATTGHGVGGVGGVQANDANCGSCHTAAAIATVHVAVTAQDRKSSLFADCASFGTCSGNTNAAWLASNLNNLPEGAIKLTYDVKSVSRNSSMRPVMVFRILQNGARTDFNASPAGTGKTDAELSNLEMFNNFMGSPSAYFVWAVPQDGITAPADFNASASGYLRSIWNGKASGTGAGTLTGPDADGYYTVTLTGVAVPDTAVMLTGGLGYSYAPATTMPLTQTNLVSYPVTAATANGTGGSVTLTAFQPNKTGGLIVVAPDVQVVGSAGAAAGGTGGAYTGRRAIVEDRRCNNCHQELGVFNASQFHAGQRNDGSTCSWCHTPNRSSSGWSADSTNFIHAIHGELKRTNDFTWHAASTTEGFWSIGYPGVLKNCEACHLPGSYDFSASGRLTAAANKQYRYAAVGNLSATDRTTLPGFAYSPWITPGTNYGSGFSFNAGTGVTTQAAATTLVESPTATVCFACHDNETTPKPNIGGMTARAHMEANGGVIYGVRGAAATLTNNETCLTSCHGPNSATNIRAVHSK